MHNCVFQNKINGPIDVCRRISILGKSIRLTAFLVIWLPLVGYSALLQEFDQNQVVSHPEFDPSIPGPGSWPAFHADRANLGSLFVATDFALKPKWSFNVGPVLYSSPVIGGNGHIYLGDLDGRLYAINRFGNLSWSLDFTNAMGAPPAMINSSPAVSENGAIYVVSTEVLDDEIYRSTLHLVGSNGAVIRSTPLPDGGYTTSSPKIWRQGGEDFIFLYARLGFDSSALIVFNKFAEVIAQMTMGCNTPVTGSSSVWDFIGDVLEVFKDAFYEGGPGIDFDTSGEIASLSERFGWLDPTVAVIDGGAGRSEGGRPLIVLVDKACFFKLLRWDGAGLSEIWSNRHDFRFQSSPVVLEAAQTIVLGGEDGRVRGFDLSDGHERWNTDLKFGPIMATPASLGGSIAYVIADRGIATIDAGDGRKLMARSFEGQSVASPALSGSHLFVSTDRELVSYSVNLLDHVHVHDGRGGLASPAIGADGTIYVIAPGAGRNRLLRAYGGLTFTLPEAGSRGVIGP